jgi:hypothetical protein
VLKHKLLPPRLPRPLLKWFRLLRWKHRLAPPGRSRPLHRSLPRTVKSQRRPSRLRLRSKHRLLLLR